MKVSLLNSNFRQFASNPIANKRIDSVRNIDNNSIQAVDVPVKVSFTGNPSKHTNQIASIACEYQGPLNNVYKAGGLGNVAGEAAVAFNKHGNADIRTFIPYHSFDNQNGGIKVKTPYKTEDAKPVLWEKHSF